MASPYDDIEANLDASDSGGFAARPSSDRIDEELAAHLESIGRAVRRIQRNEHKFLMIAKAHNLRVTTLEGKVEANAVGVGELRDTLTQIEREQERTTTALIGDDLGHEGLVANQQEMNARVSRIESKMMMAAGVIAALQVIAPLVIQLWVR